MGDCGSKGCGCSAVPISQPTALAQLTAESAQAVYRIENMDCPTEEALIRSKLGELPGVVGLDFNHAAHLGRAARTTIVAFG